MRTTRPVGGGGPPHPATRVPWLFVLPALLLYLAFFLGPTLVGAGYAFTDWNGLSAPRWVGLGNFSEIFSDPKGRAAVVHTVLLCAIYVVVVNACGLLLAIGLTNAIKTRNLLRALFFAPVVVSPLAVAYIWKFILDPDGPLNQGLRAVGLDGLAQPWLGKPTLAFGALVVTMVWQLCGYHMIILMAGLQSIQPELYEAASIDGAGAWRRFWDVTRPLLLPAMAISV
ncbi:MAG: carbohydrate ABC transporter permease, partial [Conexibacter sp.]